MSLINFFGYLAAVCTTVAFVPQVLKTWRSKSAKDLSLSMFAIFCLGVVSWLVYGIANNDLPITIANGMTLVLASTLLYFKLTFKE